VRRVARRQSGEARGGNVTVRAACGLILAMIAAWLVAAVLAGPPALAAARSPILSAQPNPSPTFCPPFRCRPSVTPGPPRATPTVFDFPTPTPSTSPGGSPTPVASPTPTPTPTPTAAPTTPPTPYSENIAASPPTSQALPEAQSGVTVTPQSSGSSDASITEYAVLAMVVLAVISVVSFFLFFRIR